MVAAILGKPLKNEISLNTTSLLKQIPSPRNNKRHCFVDNSWASLLGVWIALVMFQQCGAQPRTVSLHQEWAIISAKRHQEMRSYLTIIWPYLVILIKGLGFQCQRCKQFQQCHASSTMKMHDIRNNGKLKKVSLPVPICLKRKKYIQLEPFLKLERIPLLS